VLLQLHSDGGGGCVCEADRRDHPRTAQNPFPPTKIFSIFQSLRKILKKKTTRIIENTRNIVNIILIFRICGIKVSKIQVEREVGVGGWWVMPSM